MQGIAGRVAIITGGASGIGAGLVRIFAEAGARVVSADIAAEAGAAIAARHGCDFVPTDLRRDADVRALVAAAVARHGGIDFLINAAASYADEGLETDRETWRAGVDANLIGHVMLVQAALEHLKRSTWPSIVNFTSESAHVGLAGRWVYPATKAAIEQVTRSEALDLAPFGIRANAVMPGWTEKPWQATAPAEVQERYRTMSDRLHMLGRQGTIEEVGQAVLFLCSEHAGFVTGSIMRVDGGHSALGPQGKEKHLPTKVRQAAGLGTTNA